MGLIRIRSTSCSLDVRFAADQPIEAFTRRAVAADPAKHNPSTSSKHNVQASRPAARRGAAYYLYKNKKDEPGVGVSHAEASRRRRRLSKPSAGTTRARPGVDHGVVGAGCDQNLVKMFKPELMAPAPGAASPSSSETTSAPPAVLQSIPRHVPSPKLWTLPARDGQGRRRVRRGV